jgi:peptide/nickel transport system permease protein
MRLARRFLSNWQNWIGLGIVSLFIVISLAAPVLAPPEGTNLFNIFFKGPTETQELQSSPQPPNRDNPLGTLPHGSDVYHTLIWDTRSAIRLGLIVAFGSAILGIIIGAVGGYAGGVFNQIVLWVTDSFLAFPPIAGVVLFRALLGVSGGFGLRTGPPSPIQWLYLTLHLDPVMITLILFTWTRYARLINANVSRMKELQYIQASKALGASSYRVLFRHLIPNAISPAIVLIATDIGSAVILAATFTFVGLGGNSPWGSIIVMGRDWIIGPGGNPFMYWWTFVPASLALILFGTGWNVLGDGLNAALEPRTA